MEHHTLPIATPKAPYVCRTEALNEEALFDLAEFGAWGEPRDPHGPCWTISRALLERVEDVPFGALAHTDAAERLAALRPRAEAALERARQHFGERFTGALMFGFILDFAAPLPRRADEPSFGFVRMHCGPDQEGEVAITLLEPREFPGRAR